MTVDHLLVYAVSRNEYSPILVQHVACYLVTTAPDKIKLIASLIAPNASRLSMLAWYWVGIDKHIAGGTRAYRHSVLW
jgi:hypothetical protein